MNHTHGYSRGRLAHNGLGEEAERADNLHSTFIRNVEHELRTPLAVMMGYAELLQQGDFGALAPEQQQAMFVIVDRAAAMRTLVERVGVLMELEAGVDAMTPLALDEIAAQVVEAKHCAASQSGVELFLSTEPDLPLVSGNPRLLRQAFECLVENAIKFNRPNGQVEVRVYAESGWVCFSVSDTGIGILPEHLAHLFKGFYQADGSTTRRYGGIGLGLTIVRGVAERHGGQIAVESQPGQGSQFTLRFPAPQPADEAAQPAADSAAPWRILVVDDEESVAQTLRNGLSRIPGCTIGVATSGEQALELLGRNRYDLMITDYKMPGMDGLTLAMQVRQTYPSVKILMLTAYSSDELQAQAERISIQRILDKPAKLSQVRSAVTEVLNGN